MFHSWQRQEAEPQEAAVVETLVMRFRIWMILGCAFAFLGCDFDSGDKCEAGAQARCTGESGCHGTRHCNVGSWGACECDPDTVGDQCKRDSDCGEYELCLTENGSLLLGGGFPGGVCARECTNDHSACDEDDEPTTCVATTGSRDDARAFCLLTCALGDGRTNKCNARSDMACDESLDGTSEPFCRPLCVSDNDCREGGRCDPATGACVEALANEGLRFGEECEADGEGPLCRGICLWLGDSEAEDTAYCSHRCVLGLGDVCAWDSDGVASGYCEFLGAPSSDVHDSGYCAPLCNSDSDCLHPRALCVESPAVEGVTGQKGTCSQFVDVAPSQEVTDAGRDEKDAGARDGGD